MSPLMAGALALATAPSPTPSPDPTEGTLRPGLEEWQVSPGLIGFVVTFALAVACVLLFLNMSKHLRRAGHNARQQGLPVPAPQVVSFRRPDAATGSDGAGSAGGTAAGGKAGGDKEPDSPDAPDAPGGSGSGASDTGSAPSGGGSSGGDGGGSGD
jgi:hypothetical protein